ncbi:hypothetical protein PGTUg99_010384 [Puccinia graminis f. sp. tritici]|uniref:Uncharacterized protein n=1 Tax=Puccinia graminis f. sp. tritici TaxID=56615 RepID=A0A5B0LIQ8_PUCGR|nr:hypothetical protein PGTUg99_010384 [Puccinia graminis f. sp. tritici]
MYEIEPPDFYRCKNRIIDQLLHAKRSACLHTFILPLQREAGPGSPHSHQKQVVQFHRSRQTLNANNNYDRAFGEVCSYVGKCTAYRRVKHFGTLGPILILGSSSAGKQQSPSVDKSSGLLLRVPFFISVYKSVEIPGGIAIQLLEALIVSVRLRIDGIQ